MFAPSSACASGSPLYTAGVPETHAAPGASAVPTDRDARGRFAPGNQGGPGNPFARRVAALRQSLLDAVPPKISRPSSANWWRPLVQAMWPRSAWCWPTPWANRPQPWTPTPWTCTSGTLFQQQPVSNQALLQLLGPLQVPLACLLARTLLPLLQQTSRQHLAQQLQPETPQPTEPNRLPAQPLDTSVPEAKPTASNRRTTAHCRAPAEHATTTTTRNQAAGSERSDRLQPAGPQSPVPHCSRETRRGNGRAAEAELHRWLEVCQRCLFRGEPAAGDSPASLARAWPAEC